MGSNVKAIDLNAVGKELDAIKLRAEELRKSIAKMNTAVTQESDKRYKPYDFVR